MEFYDTIAAGYDELYEEEQLKKCRLIARHFEHKGRRILDVGCGTGIATGFFDCEAGVDPSEELLRIAQKKFPKMQFIQANAEDLPFGENDFDAVISLTAIQNFGDIEKGLGEIKRVGRDFVLTFLKKSGKRDKIERSIKGIFRVNRIIEEEKDIICFCKKD